MNVCICIDKLMYYNYIYYIYSTFIYIHIYIHMGKLPYFLAHRPRRLSLSVAVTVRLVRSSLQMNNVPRYLEFN